MLKHSRSERRAGLRRRTSILAIMLMAPIAVLTAASPAAAAPKGIFAVFSDCPVKFPGVFLCQYAQTTSGSFTIGNTKVPINQTITLQGGAVPTGAKENEYFLIPAADGNSLSKTELNVPGGLLDFINCEEIKGEGFFEKGERSACKAFFENKVTGVTATTELVANEHDPALLNIEGLFNGVETALTLPVRVHLNNPLLGGSCYVGSESSPILLHLITGKTSPPKPNEPISGKFGIPSVETEGEGEVLVLRENSLVDNSFSAPAAEGCGGFFSFLIDPILDAKIGLPAKAGHNTAILTGTVRTALAESVVASEK